jgi:hypothetical protein
MARVSRAVHQHIFIILLLGSLDVPAVLKPPGAIKNGPERACCSFVIKFGAIGDEIAAIYNKFSLYSAPTVSSFNDERILLTTI